MGIGYFCKEVDSENDRDELYDIPNYDDNDIDWLGTHFDVGVVLIRSNYI